MRGSQSWTIFLATVLALASPDATGASDSATAGTVEVTLRRAKAHVAATALRTIANTQFEIVAENVLRVQGTPEKLQLAEQVLALVDSGTDTSLTAFTVPSDQSRVGAFRLEHAAPAAAMKALRTVLQISRVVVQEEPTLVIVRDTAEQVAAAEALLEIVDRACP